MYEDLFVITYNHLYLFLVAVIFTIVGIFIARRDPAFYEKVVETTIDNLIEDGYIKVRPLPNGDVELIKHRDWEFKNDKDE